MALANDNPVGRDADSLLAAGDSRANVQPGLIALHTLFAREHNRLCDVYKKKYPQVSWKYLSNKIDITESTVWEERSLLKVSIPWRWRLPLNPLPEPASDFTSHCFSTELFISIETDHSRVRVSIREILRSEESSSFTI